MLFKPRKSRSLIVTKGSVNKNIQFKIQGELIPSIIDSPIKCLGKWYDSTLKDARSVHSLLQQVGEGMRCIDKTGLPGKFKAWMFQHGLLPRLLWPLMLYEVGQTAVQSMERTINKYLRRWLGVPACFSSTNLYSRTSRLQLPLASLAEEFKVGKARLVMTLRDSKDEKIRRAGIEVLTGRRWSASKAVEQAESSLKHKDIIGTVCTGRQGLGTTQRQAWQTANQTQRREMVQQEIRTMEEEGRKAKAVEMGAQGAWTRWETVERKITWQDIWRYHPLQLQFLLRAVYDVLPTPTNLHRWGLSPNPSCALCGGIGSLNHILTACKTALTQGRYRWRHDQVLRQLADLLDTERRKKKRATPRTGPTDIHFVREGEKVKNGKKERASGLLAGAEDWEMRADLGKRLQFPSIVQTTQRPDIVIWSPKRMSIIIVELTQSKSISLQIVQLNHRLQHSQSQTSVLVC